MHRDLIDELSQPPHLILVRGRERIQCLAQRAYERGELVRPLAGVYAAADTAGLDALAVVVGTVHPDAVISGRAAAALTWWPELEASGLTAVARHRLAGGDGISFAKGVVPPELIVESNGIRLTHPSLTVLDLVPELGGEAIDEALRRGVVTLDQLWEALALTPSVRATSSGAGCSKTRAMFPGRRPSGTSTGSIAVSTCPDATAPTTGSTSRRGLRTSTSRCPSCGSGSRSMGTTTTPGRSSSGATGRVTPSWPNSAGWSCGSMPSMSPTTRTGSVTGCTASSPAARSTSVSPDATGLPRVLGGLRRQ